MQSSVKIGVPRLSAQTLTRPRVAYLVICDANAM